MADWHAIAGVYNIKRAARDEEFEEEDIWSVVKQRGDSSSMMTRKPCKDYSSSSSSSSSSSAWRVASSSLPRVIPRANTICPSSIAAAATTTASEEKVIQKLSAPVNIPDWSKIYGKNARGGAWANDDEGQLYPGSGYRNDDVNDNDDDDEDDEEMVPPHEWIAKKLARSRISSSSVCEGIGRTLKGRDLSKVRNAILTKTGFLE